MNFVTDIGKPSVDLQFLLGTLLFFARQKQKPLYGSYFKDINLAG